MAKYYQHIIQGVQEFQNVTKLCFIDDEDPDMVLYYFADGTKCNRLYIGELNDFEAFSKHCAYAEINSPNNKWTFREYKLQIEQQTAVGNDGLTYTIPDAYMTNLNGNRIHKDGIRYDAVPPRRTSGKGEPINEYLLSYIRSMAESGTKISNPDVTTVVLGVDLHPEYAAAFDPAVIAVQTVAAPKPVASPKSAVTVKPITKEEEQLFGSVSNDEPKATLDCTAERQVYETAQHAAQVVYSDKGMDILKSDNIEINLRQVEGVKIVIHDLNGNKHTYTVEEFNKFINMPAAVQQPVQPTDDDVPIDIINTPEWSLVNNMIDMAVKEECSIDFTLGLTLPPKNIYTLIKSFYKPGMADAFIKTIANRMAVKDLRYALADGLKMFYDDEIEVQEEIGENDGEKEFNDEPSYTPFSAEINASENSAVIVNPNDTVTTVTTNDVEKSFTFDESNEF